MTAPTINGTKYPQPVDELLPAARKLADELGEVPSRNRLMKDFRIGAPKAQELRERLIEEKAREIVVREHENSLRRRMADQFGYTPPDERDDVDQAADEPAADPWQYAEPIGPDPVPADPDPGPDPVDIPLDDTPAPTAEPDRTEALRGQVAARGSLMTPRTDPADTQVRPAVEPDPAPAPAAPAAEPDEQVTPVGHPGTPATGKPRKPLPVWPVWLLMLPAFVAVWAGWVELGKLTGFGPVDLLPGFTRDGEPLLTLDTAITLPIGMETYAGYALYIWLSGRTTRRARTFAMASALIALTLGAGAQITYHLLTTPDTGTPWQITTIVACLPVAVLGMGAALAHLVREEH